MAFCMTLVAEFVSESDLNWVTEINETFVLLKVMAMFIAKVKKQKKKKERENKVCADSISRFRDLQD